MPKWLQTLLALIGLGAKEYVDVKTGAATPAQAVTDGAPQAAPLVTELVHEIHDATKKPAPAPPAKS